MDFKHKGLTYFKECAILPFSYSIFLWCMWTRSLVNEAMGGEKNFQMLVHVFPIVGSKNLRLSFKLGDNHIIELDKRIKNFRFVFQEMHPAYSSTIINNKTKYE